MKTLIIYDSYFGNTKEIAYAIGEAFKKKVWIKKVGDFDNSDLEDCDILIVGSPTRGFRPTQNINDFLTNIPKGTLKGVKVAAFDTRMTEEELKSNIILKILSKFISYAAPAIERILVEKGGEISVPSEGFFVQGAKGPLKKGEIERAKGWGKKILKK